MFSLAARCWALFRDLWAPPPAKDFSGRTIPVRTIADIRLKQRELVLTFDDGPLPGCTERILAILEDIGVKATFLMVGAPARANPATVRMVAQKGHTIGSHTENHADLRVAEPALARAEIDAGRDSVAAPLQSSHYRATPLFRFPYLADTPLLRDELAGRGIVVLDVDINIGDDSDLSPQELHRQALRRIVRRGSGIVLMHDIHARTAAMLPNLLADLKRKGFTIVHLIAAA
ncbi:MAG: polysaccharide deacetylase family protein [Mesorhizobium sp.]|uniref:polysaccharide deacetylase family protein n=1 Tax=Mesorhizobium sp. TaxID=1871066 RepID=UPI001ACCC98D|nr:polysaccharide deacetylase family protein [Mesorhizobium sp.]MBN9220677.1 polysaccharide deacetylase family protein [Mesorhizobium sp.]